MSKSFRKWRVGLQARTPKYYLFLASEADSYGRGDLWPPMATLLIDTHSRPFSATSFQRKQKTELIRLRRAVLPIPSAHIGWQVLTPCCGEAVSLSVNLPQKDAPRQVCCLHCRGLLFSDEPLSAYAKRPGLFNFTSLENALDTALALFGAQDVLSRALISVELGPIVEKLLRQSPREFSH